MIVNVIEALKIEWLIFAPKLEVVWYHPPSSTSTKLDYKDKDHNGIKGRYSVGERVVTIFIIDDDINLISG